MNHRIDEKKKEMMSFGKKKHFPWGKVHFMGSWLAEIEIFEHRL